MVNGTRTTLLSMSKVGVKLTVITWHEVLKRWSLVFFAYEDLNGEELKSYIHLHPLQKVILE